MASILIPAFSAILASCGAFRLSSSQPSRIFNVTGTSTASTTAAIIAPARCGSRIKAEPDNLPVTFLAGQPILISIKLAPRSAQIFAASAITGGSQPASWIDSGASAIASVRNFRISLFTSRRTAALAIISVTTKPPPQRRTARRNGQSVTPDIGARMAAWGKMFPSIARDIKDPETDPKRQAPIMNIGKTPT